MLKHILLVGIVVSSFHSFSQQYRTALGVKGDWSNLDYDLAQVSVKHFFFGQNAMEANLGFASRYLWLEGMYHYNMPLAQDVEWYLGGGVDIGYWFARNARSDNPNPHQGIWSGATGVVGLELTTNVIPLNFALDVGPTFRLSPQNEIGVKVGFAARYAFK